MRQLQPYPSGGMIRFLFEYGVRGKWNPYLSIPSSIVHSDNSIISVFQTGEMVTSSYWTAWGGKYDIPLRSDVELFLGVFYSKVYTLDQLRTIDQSYFVDGNKVYISSPLYTWQYVRSALYVSEIEGFSSCVRDAGNPSDDTYSGVSYPPLLAVPSIPMAQMPDNVNGIVPLAAFSISLFNNDGRFDSFDVSRILNTPVRVKKSGVLNPSLDDFVTIRTGYVDDATVTFDTFTLKISDPIRSFTQDACRVITAETIEGAEGDCIGKPLPLAWGLPLNVPLIRISKTLFHYIAVDPDYFGGVRFVYDSDGKEVPFSLAGTVIVTSKEVSTADIIGRDYTMGKIITSEVSEKCSLPYIEQHWDLEELGSYEYSSPAIALYFPEGTVQKLINDVLKNDMAIMFCKNDGRMTIRSWGKKYEGFSVESWLITKKPVRTYSDQKQFCSSVSVGYWYDNKKRVCNLQTVDASAEDEVFSQYSKKQRLTYETRLMLDADPVALATKLLGRQSKRSEIQNINVGCDVSQVNALDEIVLSIVINGRKFSDISRWIVRSIDPAQDRFELEESSTFEQSFEGVMVQPSIVTVPGVASNPSIMANSGVASNPFNSKESI